MRCIAGRAFSTGFTDVKFLDTLKSKQKRFQTLDQGVRIQTLDQKVGFLLDAKPTGRRFSFEDIAAEEQGLAFRTRDAKLVTTYVPWDC